MGNHRPVGLTTTVRIVGVLAAAGFGALLTAVSFSPHGPIYDERFFLPNLYLFDDLGLSRQFLTEMDNQAPGPLYEFIHAAFRPLTGYRVPGIRFVNVVCLACLSVITWLTARQTRAPRAELVALNYLAIPMVITVSGMALTEMPAMLFLGASIFLLSVVYESERLPPWQAIGCSVSSGLCLGAAILGRSPFLLVALALPVLLYRRHHVTRIWVAISLVGISMGCVVTPVFLTWGGLTPPKIVHPAGLDYGPAAMAFAYAGVVTFILAPGWFLPRKLLVAATPAFFLLVAVANAYWWHLETAPLSHFMQSILPEAAFETYAATASALFLTLGLLFVASAAYRFWGNREDPWYGFVTLATLAVVFSTAKTHTFSSRYVVQVAPLLVLVLAPYDRPAWFKPPLYLVGMLLGFASLLDYYSYYS